MQLKIIVYSGMEPCINCTLSCTGSRLRNETLHEIVTCIQMTPFRPSGIKTIELLRITIWRLKLFCLSSLFFSLGLRVLMESYFVIQKNRICFRKICPRLVSVSYLSKKNINTGHLRVWPEVVNENKRNLNKLSSFISGALKNEKRIYLKGSNPRRRRQRGCGKTKETKEQ